MLFALISQNAHKQASQPDVLTLFTRGSLLAISAWLTESYVTPIGDVITPIPEGRTKVSQLQSCIFGLAEASTHLESAGTDPRIE